LGSCDRTDVVLNLNFSNYAFVAQETID
jgi:hypothetical protein